MIRLLLAALVIAAACFASHRYSEHHVGKNAFETLYFHVMPSRLAKPHASAAATEGEHGAAAHGTDAHAFEPLLEIPLPGWLAFIDHRGPEEHPDGVKTVLFNLQIFQVTAVLLVLILFSGVPSYVRTGKGDLPSRLFAGFAMWIRDEMVYPVMGRELGSRFLPYFLCIFFFIVFMNLMGLVPYSATPTANVFVTAGLAVTTLAAMIGCGMAAQGPIAYWKNLVPHVPLALWPLMFLVELIGVFVKPFALTIRLFANMSGGHLVVLSFMALIFFFAGSYGRGGGFGVAPVGVGFAVFIMIVETFVALLQAYIFTQLSIIFVNASVHPEH